VHSDADFGMDGLCIF